VIELHCEHDYTIKDLDDSIKKPSQFLIISRIQKLHLGVQKKKKIKKFNMINLEKRNKKKQMNKNSRN
jgi:mannose/fructose/N-acetylgalactosamine-specific phosphotransferase system component IIB